MFRLPFLLNLRTGAVVEIITAGVAGGQSFVPMQIYAHQFGYWYALPKHIARRW